MRTKRKIAAVIAAGVAPLLAVTLPASSANAHGWVTSPDSRQDQCADRVVACGDIQWEPQSVEAPKGSNQCNGGGSRFAELNDDGKGWRVSSVGSSTTFTWTLKVPHRTSTWQYFIGGSKIAEFNQGGAQPPLNVSHNVNFGGFTGRQKVLAVWNVYDTANAFYACVDVNIGGGGGTGGTTGGSTGGSTGGGGDSCNATAWSSGAVYTGGTQVSHNNHNWRAKWWTQGEEPGTTGEWGVWEDLGAC